MLSGIYVRSLPLTRSPTILPARFVFQARDEYHSGEGIRSKGQVFEEKKDDNPEEFTITGKRKPQYFFYSDRKSGKGYTDFSHSPFEHRQYVWPPLRKQFKLAPYILAVLASPLYIDYAWLYYHIKRILFSWSPLLEEFYNEHLRSFRGASQD